MPPPFKEAEFYIMFGEGISRVGDILDLATNLNIVNKSGAWFAYEGNKIGQGRENAKTFLKDNPAVCDEIEQKVRAQYELDKKKKRKLPIKSGSRQGSDGCKGCKGRKRACEGTCKRAG